MGTETTPTGENLSPGWVVIAKEHLRELNKIHPLASDTIPSGFVFVQDDQIAGYMLFTPKVEGDKKIMYIDDLEVLDEFRSSVALLMLFKMLDAYTRTEGITHVGGVPASPTMNRFSEKIAGQPHGNVLLTVEELKKRLLSGGI